MKIRAIADNKPDEADLLVCMPATAPAVFTDDLYALCSQCGVKVRYRPTAPKKPKKICTSCGAAAMAENPDCEVGITATTAREIGNYFRRQKH